MLPVRFERDWARVCSHVVTSALLFDINKHLCGGFFVTTLRIQFSLGVQAGGMFGNIVTKNARAALKEYGDRNGVGVDYHEVEHGLMNGGHGGRDVTASTQFTVFARVGERTFEHATASSKKDAREYAADLALRVLAQGKVLRRIAIEGTCMYMHVA